MTETKEKKGKSSADFFIESNSTLEVKCQFLGEVVLKKKMDQLEKGCLENPVFE